MKVSAPVFREVEQIVERPGDGIEGAVADSLTVEPVVFDKADDGGLVGHGVIDVVSSCVRRNYLQGKTRAMAAVSQPQISGVGYVGNVREAKIKMRNRGRATIMLRSLAGRYEAGMT
jgi:hypothetical protein